jgi:glutamate-ammonia-ligase adenylyltransferase
MADRIERLCAYSAYAQQALQAHPGLLTNESLDRPFTRAEMRAAIEPARDPDTLAVALRRLRRAVMLRSMGRDLAGLADLDEVTAVFSALAEEALGAGLRVLGAAPGADYGQPIGSESGQPQPMLVVGMGKLGGVELNVSSDIDLVFLYPEEGETDGPRRISNHEYFVRLGRRLIALLGERTADGYVFRVDMRLRPYGDSGPLAASLPAFEEYLVSQGREWERYAWIKGRVVAASPGTDPAVADAQLAQIVSPFVYRRHLDYSALGSMRELYAQIRREAARRDIQDDIKLGPGGIRQIEFVAQVFQLVRGGRDPGLRQRPTRAVLRAIEQRRLLSAEGRAALDSAYEFLRQLEHRLQYRDDAQTHRLPASPDDRQALARSMGYPDRDAFEAALAAHRAAVVAAFDRVLGADSSDDGASPYCGLWDEGLSDEDGQRRLAEAGYRDPGGTLERLRRLRASGVVRRMAAATQQRLDALLPRMVAQAAACAEPDTVLERLLQIAESIGRRESYLALLIEYPNALEGVARLAAASPWAAQYLAQHPILLDELLDARRLDEPSARADAERELRPNLDATSGNVERQLDILRHFKHSQLFRLVIHDLAGQRTPETVSDHLTELADVVLEHAVERCWAALASRHRDAPRFAVIGYGKLGGKELGYGSDLDLVFLSDDDAPGAEEIYARYALRLNTWLTTVTGAGVLYRTDLRLRPDGDAGLLVSPYAAFERYQLGQAWVWEHQALTRARYVAGDPALGARFETLRARVLQLERDPARLRDEVAAMRERMRASKRAAGGTFDIKHSRGGLVDVEFIVQYLVLRHARAHPSLLGNLGNIALLRESGRLGLVPVEFAQGALEAYRALRRKQHAMQLAGHDPAHCADEDVPGLTEPVRRLWERLFEAAPT